MELSSVRELPIGPKEMATRTKPQMTLETRAKLIALAREAFGAKGYAATSLEELMIAAAMTKGALYHHFSSKLGLFEAVVDEIDAESRQHVEAAIKAAGGKWKGFKAGCRAYLALMQRPETRRIILLDAPSHLPDFANRPYTQLCTAAICDALQALMDQGEIVRLRPEALANIIAGAVTRAAGWGAAQADPAIALPAAAAALDAVLEGLEL